MASGVMHPAGSDNHAISWNSHQWSCLCAPSTLISENSRMGTWALVLPLPDPIQLLGRIDDKGEPIGYGGQPRHIVRN